MITLKLNRAEQALLLKLLDSHCCTTGAAELYEKILAAKLQQPTILDNRDPQQTADPRMAVCPRCRRYAWQCDCKPI